MKAPGPLLCGAMLLACCAAVRPAAAQELPSGPLTLGDGRVVLGGSASVSVGPDDEGFFNYSDYEHSALRELRLAVTALVRATDRIAVLGEIRSQNLDGVTPFALYARVRPFPGKRLDVQIGRIPPTFGSVTRQAYGRENALIGTPLAYQYLTSLRADAIPASADELLRMRGRGWRSSFSIGDQAAERGVPLVSSFTWDTGIQVSTGWRILTMTGAVTNGTASNPRVSDDNGGKQVTARVAVAPIAGLTVGTSFGRGAFLSRRVASLAGAADEGSFVQQVHGVDLEYARGHWTIRADAVSSRWTIPPFAGSAGPVPLRAGAISVEGRYTVMPGMYVAARAEHLAFSRIAGSAGLRAWDAPVTRVETGVGYYLQRNLIGRVSLQVNDRDAGRVRHATLMAAQLLYWF